MTLLDISIFHEVAWAFSDLLYAGVRPAHHGSSRHVRLVRGASTIELRSTADFALIAKSPYFIQELVRRFSKDVFWANNDDHHGLLQLELALRHANHDVLEYFLDQSNVIARFSTHNGDGSDLWPAFWWAMGREQETALLFLHHPILP